MRNRNLVISLLAILVLVPMACSSLNQVTPKALDDAAIEAEVRKNIAEDVVEKTFAVEVTVSDGVVTLSGHAANEAQRRLIADAANDVEGVKQVINNIHVQ